ncbi:MAG: hypothetical protein QG639_1075 [Patescibacteria group bacterium]|nr:hypothetical protein [Patescibacteria group bacterium]
MYEEMLDLLNVFPRVLLFKARPRATVVLGEDLGEDAEAVRPRSSRSAIPRPLLRLRIVILRRVVIRPALAQCAIRSAAVILFRVCAARVIASAVLAAGAM